ncbi:hypothetical protein V490_00464 [Pseudogymnoascus sp. VKM F-3557]|nr:hypothetical protein V490_00464 [Pseudogymnoascus sp. VKM F-3557]
MEPYYYVTHDYRPETVSSKAEICIPSIPNGESPPERIAMPFVPPLKYLSEGDHDTLLSLIQSLRQNNQDMADYHASFNQDMADPDHTSINQHMADLDHVSLNQDMADIGRASHTYGDNGDKGNVTLRSMARKLLYRHNLELYLFPASQSQVVAAMKEQPFSGPKPSSLVSSTATGTILASDKRDTPEDRRSRKREHDRKMDERKRHKQKEYIRSLQEQRDSLLEHHISTMNLSERNERLEKENAQLLGQLIMLLTERMVQYRTLVATESYPSLAMASDSATNKRTH